MVMDCVPVINSEVHHLGYKGTEAYGITWKVRVLEEMMMDRVVDAMR